MLPKPWRHSPQNPLDCTYSVPSKCTAFVLTLHMLRTYNRKRQEPRCLLSVVRENKMRRQSKGSCSEIISRQTFHKGNDNHYYEKQTQHFFLGHSTLKQSLKTSRYPSASRHTSSNIWQIPSWVFLSAGGANYVMLLLSSQLKPHFFFRFFLHCRKKTLADGLG